MCLHILKLPLEFIFTKFPFQNSNRFTFYSVFCDFCVVGHFVFKSFKKAVAPHSSTLAWKTPWTEEPGRLQSMGSLRV